MATAPFVVAFKRGAQRRSAPSSARSARPFKRAQRRAPSSEARQRRCARPLARSLLFRRAYTFGDSKMRKRTLLFVAAISALGACSRTESGDIEVKRPADVDVKTTTDTLRLPSIGTKIDTINTPTMGTKKDTIIVD